MLKEYLNYKKTTMYRLAKDNNIPYSNINSIANAIIKADNISSGLLYNIARALNVPMDELYLACGNNDMVYSEEHDSVGFISESDNTYHVRFFHKMESIERDLCSVNDNSTYFIHSIARWKIEDCLRDRKMKEMQYALLFDEKK